MLKDLVDKRGYGDVLSEEITLKDPRTYQTIVRRLSKVSFDDSSFDSKGAAFEYYVRATLKGKRLGQYFTPRAVVHLMSVLVGRDKVSNSLLSGEPLKALDPACGTGGFLVFLMKQSLAQIEAKRKSGKITEASFQSCSKRLRESVFFGADANPSVASAAKMNMIIAGDGHSNIVREDSLALNATSWSATAPDYDVIITNPPFGTSEADSLSKADYLQFSVVTSKGQLLFLQKMVGAVKHGGDICTVIDEGVLNTESSAPIRRWLIEHCDVRVVLRLPEVTFKPNKISVKSSVLLLRRKTDPDVDGENDYNVTFVDVKNLGYYGSGEPIRGFDELALMGQIESYVHDDFTADPSGDQVWNAFKVPAEQIRSDKTCRLDLKYWIPSCTETIAALGLAGGQTLESIVTEDMRRGLSPASDDYVDEKDGYAIVLKAGSNINKFGEVVFVGDYVEKNLYEDLKHAWVTDGDLLISSTGNGTLGKCAVYRDVRPAIADSHVTIVKLDPELCYPEYVCDYLRLGFGAMQIQRLYTGSTNMVELTPDHLKVVVIELPDLDAQKAASQEWRSIEVDYRSKIATAEQAFAESMSKFLAFSQAAPMLQEADTGPNEPEG